MRKPPENLIETVPDVTSLLAADLVRECVHVSACWRDGETRTAPKNLK